MTRQNLPGFMLETSIPVEPRDAARMADVEIVED
jgi:hypothetical protein